MTEPAVSALAPARRKPLPAGSVYASVTRIADLSGPGVTVGPKARSDWETGDYVLGPLLCASDPYAVVGVASAYGVRPDLVAGRATSTSAAIALCERLAGVECLNLLDPDTHGELDALLAAKLGL